MLTNFVCLDLCSQKNQAGKRGWWSSFNSHQRNFSSQGNQAP